MKESLVEQLAEVVVDLLDDAEAVRVLLVVVQEHGVVEEQDGVGGVLEALELAEVELDLNRERLEGRAVATHN